MRTRIPDESLVELDSTDAQSEDAFGSLSDSTYEIISQSSFHTSDDEESDREDVERELSPGPVESTASVNQTPGTASIDDVELETLGNTPRASADTILAGRSSSVSLQIPSPSMISAVDTADSPDSDSYVPSQPDPAEDDEDVTNDAEEFPPNLLTTDRWTEHTHIVTENFGWPANDHKTSLVIHQTMGPKLLRPSNPYVIHYHGHPNYRKACFDKIIEALCESYRKATSGQQSPGTEDQVSQGIKPEDYFRIAFLDLHIIMKDCVVCENRCLLPVQDYGWFERQRDESLRKVESDKARLTQYTLKANFTDDDRPDLAIFCAPKPTAGSWDRMGLMELMKCDTHAKAYHFQRIPTIHLSDKTTSAVDFSETLSAFKPWHEETMHMSIEYNKPRAGCDRVVQRCRLDIDSFKSFDNHDLNRHIACLTHLAEYELYLDSQKKSVTTWNFIPDWTAIKGQTKLSYKRLKANLPLDSKRFNQLLSRLDWWPFLIISALVLTVGAFGFAVYIKYMFSVFSGKSSSFQSSAPQDTPKIVLTEDLSSPTVKVQVPTLGGPSSTAPVVATPVASVSVNWPSENSLTLLDVNKQVINIAPRSEKANQATNSQQDMNFEVHESADGRLFLVVSGRKKRSWNPSKSLVHVLHGKTATTVTLSKTEPSKYELVLDPPRGSDSILVGIWPIKGQQDHQTFHLPAKSPKILVLAREVKSSLLQYTNEARSYVEDGLSSMGKWLHKDVNTATSNGNGQVPLATFADQKQKFLQAADYIRSYRKSALVGTAKIFYQLQAKSRFASKSAEKRLGRIQQLLSKQLNGISSSGISFNAQMKRVQLEVMTIMADAQRAWSQIRAIQDVHNLEHATKQVFEGASDVVRLAAHRANILRRKLHGIHKLGGSKASDTSNRKSSSGESGQFKQSKKHKRQEMRRKQETNH